MPSLARTLEFPEPDERTPETAALTALVRFCAESERPPTTAAVLQAFAGTVHADLFAAVLASLESESMEDAALEVEIREGLARWWHRARLEGRPVPAAGIAPLPTIEGRRLEQLEYVHRARQGASAPPRPSRPSRMAPGVAMI